MAEELSRRRPHTRLAAALRLLDQANLAPWRDMEPPALLRRGVEEFNRREFFEQHETLEELWRAEGEPVRYLYQGILQTGVGFLHLEGGNMHGAVVKLENGLALLRPFEPLYMGLDIARLRRETAACLRWVQELGSERLGEFDRSMIPLIHQAGRSPLEQPAE